MGGWGVWEGARGASGTRVRAVCTPHPAPRARTPHARPRHTPLPPTPDPPLPTPPSFRQFEAFAAGFATLCGGPAIHLFSATELERLVCGSPTLDFHALRASARYEGGYSAASQAVVWLWEVVGELAPDEARRFLKFFTGSDRSPIGGLGALRAVVQRDGGADSDKLPTSHT